MIIKNKQKTKQVPGGHFQAFKLHFMLGHHPCSVKGRADWQSRLDPTSQPSTNNSGQSAAKDEKSLSPVKITAPHRCGELLAFSILRYVHFPGINEYRPSCGIILYTPGDQKAHEIVFRFQFFLHHCIWSDQRPKPHHFGVLPMWMWGWALGK